MTAHFGLDIGSFSIKLVQAEKKDKRWRLAALGETMAPANINSTVEADKQKIATAIKKLVKEAKIKTDNVAIALPERDVYTQVIDLPYLSEDEIRSAIQFEAEQYIPVPLGEVELDHLVLSTSPEQVKDKRMEVLLTAAKKQAVNQRVALAEAADLVPIVLETEALSLVRLTNLVFGERCLVLNLGYSSSMVLVIEGQKLELVRSINTGGEALTRALARELGMEFMQAEQYKTAYGLEASVLEGKVAKSLLPTFNVILSEVNKALGFYRQKNPRTVISTLLVSGAGAGLGGANAYLAQSLNLEVINLEPFKNFMPDNRLMKMGTKARFATAVGLALRED
jgi:type IV pilus assembly protein PilM